MSPHRVPGQLDGWSLVQFSTPTTGSPNPSADSPQAGQQNRRWRRSRVLAVTAGALVLVLGTGSAALAYAHKSVTLDVDGQVQDVSTFAGSVDSLLEDHGIEVSDRDTVSASGPLEDGDEIVVRHAHRVTVLRDGVPEAVWTTALTADEALAVASVRGGAVALAASRSGERADLPIALTAPAEVVVDGSVLQVPSAITDLDAALLALHVTLGPVDRVSVREGDAGQMQVVVQRVASQQVTTTSEVPFAVVTKADASKYKGTKTVTRAGVPGVRTLVERVTTLDGVETARVVVSDSVTTAPVDQVVAVGTKARPATTSSSGKMPAIKGDAASLNWAALARCESGGRVNAVSSSGKYYGLYQFSLSTWRGVGGSGLPSEASAAEQTQRAMALYSRSGAGQWPVCGKYLFS